MEPNIVHLHEYGKSPEPLKIKIERNTKGYNWEVSASGSSIEEILTRIREANLALEAEYGSRAGNGNGNQKEA
jgi:hypothetical protein